MKSLLLLLIVFSVSCTRSIDESMSVNLDLSAFSKANESATSQSIPAGFYPAHLVANIHYDGKTAVKEWDCDRNTPIVSCQFPSSIAFSQPFPSGAGRVIQVLLVYANEDENLSFFYSHKLNVYFQGGALQVTLNNWENAGASAGLATLAGKLGSSSLGPNGILIGSYEPNRPAGYTAAQIPAVKIFKESIMGGWFDIQLFRGKNFTYALYDDNMNFVKNVFLQKKFEDFETQVSTTKAATHIRIPENYEVRPESSSWRSEKRQAEDVIIAFFDEVTGNIVNRDIGGSPGNEFEVNMRLALGNYNYTRNFLARVSSVLVDPINSSGLWVDPTNPGSTAGINQGTPNTQPPVYSSNWGGFPLEYTDGFAGTDVVSRISEGSGSPECVGGETDTIYLDTNTLCVRPYFQGLVEHSVPFRSVYQVVEQTGANRYDFLPSQPVSTDNLVQWKYLPNVVGTNASTSLIQGTSIYLVSKDNVDDRDVDCKAINLGQTPRLLVAHHAYAGGLTDTTPANTHPDDMEYLITAANLTSAQSMGINSVVAVACPYRESQPGATKQYWSSGLAGYGFGPQSTNTFAISTGNGTNPDCKSITFTGTLDPSPISVSVQGTSAGATPGYYSDSICSSSIAAAANATITIPANTPSYTVYYKDQAVGGTHNFNFSYSSGGSTPIAFAPSTASVIMPVAFSFTPPSVATCTAGTINFPGPVANAFSCTIVSGAPANVTVSNSVACTAPSGSANINITGSSTSIQFGLAKVLPGSSNLTISCPGVEIDTTSFTTTVIAP